ncbi:MAG: riboflavin kinase [Patescibacteria group bacterium]|nr:riboflavin kinase [Patescibacteria group bacterium]
MSVIIKSKVIKGEGVGKSIGFKTANLDIENSGIDSLEEFGVYDCKIKFKKNFYKGLLHYGPKKTFGNNISAEVLIINFNQDIYGKELEIEIFNKIRNIKKFASKDKLIKQIKKDIKKPQILFNNR